MKKVLLTNLLVLALGFATRVDGNTILGTDISYKPTATPGFYEVTLTSYKWCGSLPYCTENCNFSTCNQTLSVTNDSGATSINYFTFTVTLVSVTEVAYKGGTCPSSSPGTSCTAMGCNPAPGTNPGIEKYVFKGIVNIGSSSGLPASVCRVRFVYAGIERDPGYSSIQQEGFMYNYASINRCANTPNNNASPRYLNDPQFTICNGSLYQFNHSALYSNWEDSISYALVPVLKAYNTIASYTSPYSSTLPFPTPILTCDPNTGEVKFIPSIGGSANDFRGILNIEAKRWRKINGVVTLMGVTRREWDVFVLASCDANNAPYLEFSPVSTNSSGVPVLQYNICEGESFCLDLTTHDSDLDDSTYIQWDSSLAQYGATFNTNPNYLGREVAAQFCWTPDGSIAKNTPYFFTVKLRDSHCPNNARLTYTIKVMVIANPQLSITTKNASCNTLKLAYTQGNYTSEVYNPEWRIALKPNDPDFAEGFSTYPATSGQPFIKSFAKHGMYYFNLYASIRVPGFSNAYCPKLLTDSVYIDSSIINNQSVATPATCFATSTGKIEMKATSGIPPYLFRINPNDSFSSQSVYDNIATGTYYISIRDFAECETNDSIVVLQPEELNMNHVVQDILCFNDSNGSIVTTPSGGITPYQFLLNNTPASTPQFEHLKAGQYIVTLKDSNLCMQQDTLWVKQNNRVEFTSMYAPHPCNGTGSITVNALGGTSSFSYSFEEAAFQSSNTFDVTRSGFVSIRVKDENNCTQQDSILAQLPDSFTAISVQQEISCFNAKDGSVQLTAGGGIAADYRYILINRDTNTTGLFDNLDEGTYDFLIKDSNNCTIVLTEQLKNPNQIILGEMMGDTIPNQGTTLTYTVNSQPLVTYLWEVTKGTILSGQGTASVTVNWHTMGAGSIKVVGTQSPTCSEQIQKTVIIGSVGLEENIAYSTISYYPNPTRNSLTIEAPGIYNQTLEVYDIHGKLIFTEPVNAKMEVNLSDVSTGMYFLKIGTWKGKVVKEN
jgi:hypothetical protein